MTTAIRIDLPASQDAITRLDEGVGQPGDALMVRRARRRGVRVTALADPQDPPPELPKLPPFPNPWPGGPCAVPANRPTARTE